MTALAQILPPEPPPPDPARLHRGAEALARRRYGRPLAALDQVEQRIVVGHVAAVLAAADAPNGRQA